MKNSTHETNEWSQYNVQNAWHAHQMNLLRYFYLYLAGDMVRGKSISDLSVLPKYLYCMTIYPMRNGTPIEFLFTWNSR